VKRCRAKVFENPVAVSPWRAGLVAEQGEKKHETVYIGVGLGAQLQPLLQNFKWVSSGDAASLLALAQLSFDALNEIFARILHVHVFTFVDSADT
jgi:hypothetical protein